jgi:hypothetical protein
MKRNTGIPLPSATQTPPPLLASELRGGEELLRSSTAINGARNKKEGEHSPSNYISKILKAERVL